MPLSSGSIAGGSATILVVSEPIEGKGGEKVGIPMDGLSRFEDNSLFSTKETWHGEGGPRARKAGVSARLFSSEGADQSGSVP